jgi:hypothetical protein
VGRIYVNVWSGRQDNLKYVDLGFAFVDTILLK